MRAGLRSGSSCGYGGCPVLTVSPRFDCACGMCQAHMLLLHNVSI